MIKIFEKQKKGNGYAVLELIFYISLFVVLSLVVIDAMITMARSFRETSIQAEFVQSGTMMERMSREIRTSYDIDVTSTEADLKLNTKDDDGVEKIIEFKLVGSDIQLWDAGINIGNLNTPNIIVSALTFTQITTAKGKAIRVFLTIKSANDILSRTQDFYDTVVLRGSY
ncbi:MAG: hypothetical protein WC870_00485 [Candidatus Paceibacterota bacterium]